MYGEFDSFFFFCCNFFTTLSVTKKLIDGNVYN